MQTNTGCLQTIEDPTKTTVLDGNKKNFKKTHLDYNGPKVIDGKNIPYSLLPRKLF